tara:strand:+ start:146 stop:742 length:597 start_codon:yes stop_codon:yes gene_type:complete
MQKLATLKEYALNKTGWESYTKQLHKLPLYKLLAKTLAPSYRTTNNRRTRQTIQRREPWIARYSVTNRDVKKNGDSQFMEKFLKVLGYEWGAEEEKSRQDLQTAWNKLVDKNGNVKVDGTIDEDFVKLILIQLFSPSGGANGKLANVPNNPTIKTPWLKAEFVKLIRLLKTVISKRDAQVAKAVKAKTPKKENLKLKF